MNICLFQSSSEVDDAWAYYTSDDSWFDGKEKMEMFKFSPEVVILLSVIKFKLANIIIFYFLSAFG